MTLPKSPYQTSPSESWDWTIDRLERTQARPHARDLGPLLALTRRIAATTYGQAYRAGTSLLNTLILSTAARHGLAPEEPYLAVSLEPDERGALRFCILYYQEGEASETMQALAKSYATEDHQVIETNLRCDLPDHYYPCALAEVWETLQPLMVRLWNQTHPEEPRD